MRTNETSYIYLASPYSDASSQKMYDRYWKVMQTTARLFREGKMVYSPIVHCHCMADKFKMPTDIAFWWKYNRTMIAQCEEFWLLTLDGWKQSAGMRKETRFAIEKQIPIKYIEFVSISIEEFIKDE